VLIDHMSEHLFTTSDKGRQNLIMDGVRGEIVITGNPIVDAVYQNLEIARERCGDIHRELELTPVRYILATSHREENVDSPEVLANIIRALARVAEQLGDPVIFAVHPRTRKRLVEFGLWDLAATSEGLRLVHPLGYLAFLKLLEDARLAITDSGGVQQESCVLKVPCVTLRDNTEWTETVAMGANVLAGTDPDSIVAGARRMIGARRAWGNPFGDGHAAALIVGQIQGVLAAVSAGRHAALETIDSGAASSC
jgi:UDP-N-acetylglucosamine 2-epimerase (non-hydrolysing)